MASTADVAHAGDHGHHKPKHDYHLVDPSPWPLVGAIAALLLTSGAVMWMHEVPIGVWVMLLGFLGIAFTMVRWWRDVLRESFRGDHSTVVARGLRMGMGLFITSEVLFFFAFFWAFFWAALYPPETVAISWPPHLIVEPAYTLTAITIPQGEFNQHLVGPRITYGFTPLAFVSALVQFNSATHTVSSNVRLRWEYQPGSELFVVWNEQHDTFGPGFPVQNRALIVKFNRLFRL